MLSGEECLQEIFDAEAASALDYVVNFGTWTRQLGLRNNVQASGFLAFREISKTETFVLNRLLCYRQITRKKSAIADE